MKTTIVSESGSVHCPVCNGSQFTLKRTAKAKWGAGVAGVLTLGVGGALAIAAAPKRVYCLGCGENLKTGGPTTPAPARRPAPDPATPAPAPVKGPTPVYTGEVRKIDATEVRPGDHLMLSKTLFAVVTAVELKADGFKKNRIQTESSGGFMGSPGITYKIRRESWGD